MAHPDTFFHLCPVNEEAKEALNDSDNRRFVSSTSDNEVGLEIGFHVSSIPGRVMARLGRGHNADLVLRGRSISAIHVAFEIHPETHVVLLSVRTKLASSVSVEVSGSKESEPVDGDLVLVYGITYIIAIGAYHFKSVWTDKSPDGLRAMAAQELKKAMERERYARSRDLPTEDNSTMHTWHNTRIHTASNARPLFSEAKGFCRTLLDGGSFGSVFAALDDRTGQPFAIKVIRLHNDPRGVEYARSLAHAEAKHLQRLRHKNIIELLHFSLWDTAHPEIWMPMRTGSLRNLVTSRKMLVPVTDVCTMVLHQILSALDCTAYNNICHRDVKPENILYYDDSSHGQYTFQLADFGLARNQQSINGYGGTALYSAPEMFDDTGAVSKQTPKVDVWSLFVTIIDVLPKLQFPPLGRYSRGDVFRSVQAAARQCKSLAAMVQVDPNHRASAAQMLVFLFGGDGLTTPRNEVASLDSLVPAPAPAPGPLPEYSPGTAPTRRMDARTVTPHAGPAHAAAAGRVTKPQAPGRATPAKQALPLVNYPRMRRDLRQQVQARAAAVTTRLFAPRAIGAALAAQAGEAAGAGTVGFH